jgi:hypothetical protein
LLGQLGTNASKLFTGGFAGKARIVQRDRSERRGRPLGPNGVDQVGLDRDQLRADSGAGLFQPFRGLDGMQPGIVAEPVARREILCDPAIGRHLDQVFNRKDRGIHLIARLQGVAPIDEQHRPMHQDDGDAGGAGKASQPSEPLLRSRHVFVLVAVGARHDEPGQATPRQFGAQRRDARSAGGTFGFVFE